jgi:hypothetical protein
VKAGLRTPPEGLLQENTCRYIWLLFNLPTTTYPSLEDEAVIRDIAVLKEELDAAGARVFAGSLEPASQAKSLRKQPDGTLTITDGPYLRAKEHIGGLSIVECADIDEALAWGSQAAIACRAPVEVRAFFRVRPDKS